MSWKKMFWFFYVFWFPPTLWILPKLKYCFPSYFGITRWNIQKQSIIFLFIFFYQNPPDFWAFFCFLQPVFGHGAWTNPIIHYCHTLSVLSSRSFKLKLLKVIYAPKTTKPPPPPLPQPPHPIWIFRLPQSNLNQILFEFSVFYYSNLNQLPLPPPPLPPPWPHPIWFFLLLFLAYQTMPNHIFQFSNSHSNVTILTKFFRIWNLGSGIRDSEIWIQDLGSGTWDLGFRIWDLRFGT